MPKKRDASKTKRNLWACNLNDRNDEVLYRIGDFLVDENKIEPSKNTPGQASRRAILEFLIGQYIDYFLKTNPVVVYGEDVEIKDNLDEIRIKQMQQLNEVQKKKIEELNMDKRKLHDVIDKKGKKIEEINIGVKSG